MLETDRGRMTVAKPSFSVVLPVFNGAQFLQPALESIGRQRRGDFEAIVVDDGSTDDTPQLLSQWQRRDRRFRVITHPRNLGVGAARNSGLDAARCALVAHADADDENAPERFAAQLDAVARHPEVGIVGCDLRVEGRVWRYPRTAQEIRARGLWACPFAQNAALFNREILGDVRYDPELRMCEDIDLWLRTIFRVPAINLAIPLVSYRQRSGSLSRDLSKRVVMERRMVARRAALLSLSVDVEAGVAAYLGNRVVEVGAARIGAHLAVVAQRAAALGLVPWRQLRREVGWQCSRMWRNYGRRQLPAEFGRLLAATARLLALTARRELTNTA